MEKKKFSTRKIVYLAVMAAIVAEHVVNGHVVERLVIGRAD